MTDVVTLGETMLLVRADRIGPLRPGDPATVSFAGSESNVAIGLARLGHGCTWVSRVGDDAAGRLVLHALGAEGVHCAVVVDATHPTGVLVRERRTADRVRVDYVRRSSAASQLTAADVPLEQVRAARLLHVTGITPALGPGPAAAVDAALQAAADAGVDVSLDVNHRSRLWPAEDCAAVLRPLAARAAVVFVGRDELAAIGCSGDPEAGAGELLDLGCPEVVVTLGAHGAIAVTPDGVTRAGALPVTVEDPVGAGDAFVAGYLSARLDGLDVAGRLARATSCGAFAVSTGGDWEGLPHREELALLDGADVLR